MDANKSKRISSEELDERHDYVEKLLLACTPSRTAATRAKERYGVSIRTAQRYVKAVHDKWNEEASKEEQKDVSDRRHEQRKRLRQYITHMWSERNYRLVLRAEELLAKLDGNLAARQVDVNHKSTQMVEAAREMSDEELRRILAEAKREADKTVH